MTFFRYNDNGIHSRFVSLVRKKSFLCGAENYSNKVYMAG